MRTYFRKRTNLFATFRDSNQTPKHPESASTNNLSKFRHPAKIDYPFAFACFTKVK